MAGTFRQIRRRQVRQHFAERIRGCTGGVWIPPVTTVRAAPLQHVRKSAQQRPRRRRREGESAVIRLVRAGLHKSEADDGRVQEV